MQNGPTITNPTELTEREKEILRLVATGTSNKDIAHQLFISSNTVKVHLRNIFAKIGVASRTEAAMYAVRTGVTQTTISPPDTALFMAAESAPRRGWLSRQWVAVVLVFLALGLAAGMYVLLTQRSASPSLVTAIPTPTAIPRWLRLTDMPTARDGLAVAVYENQIYAIGGETAQAVTGEMELYDVSTGLWGTLKSKPIPVTDINAAVIGGKIYIPGGRLASGNVTDILESYDPGNDQWERHAPLPVAISGYAMVAYEGKLYVFGGWDGKKFLSTTYKYDPDQNKWLERMAMPTARGFAGAVTAGGKIYVVGGYNGKDALPDNEEYLPNSDTWTKRVSLPAGRYAMGLASIADLVYVVGGVGEPESTLPPLQYSYQQDHWQTFEEPFSQQWSYLGLVPIQTQLYAVGGRLNGLPTSQNLSYQAIYTIVLPIVP